VWPLVRVAAWSHVEDCIFDTDHTASLMSFNNVMRDQSESNGLALFYSSIEWREARCIHDIRCEHFIARRFRIPEWTYKTGVSNLDEWRRLVAGNETSHEQASISATLTRLDDLKDSLVRSYKIETAGDFPLPSWALETGHRASRHQSP
jgi:hypothetical protein